MHSPSTTVAATTYKPSRYTLDFGKPFPRPLPATLKFDVSWKQRNNIEPVQQSKINILFAINSNLQKLLASRLRTKIIKQQVLQNYYRTLQMKEATQSSQEDKKLLNIIQIKMYDIAQNVQIIGKQLTNNQIKDTIANTYNIFCQLKHTFENAGLQELYEVIRKMQINSVALSSILTERIDKKNDNLSKSKPPERQIPPPIKPSVSETFIQSQGKPKIQRLGGICLYNQSYMRGLQYYQVDAEQIEHQMTGKCRIKLSKKSRDEFLSSVSRQLDSKAEVEVETIGDEIRKYIKDYKQNSKINNFVSYEKELVQIIDFFKSSQLQAMSFLNKSPKNQEYTQDYINRLNDLETQFKTKQKAQKLSINQKLKLFIINLRQKLHQMQLRYQQKNAKLQLYEQSLKRQTCAIGIQTYDGVQARLKSQQNTIRQLQQRYKILSQIKNKQINFESKVYELQHQVNIKVAEVTKLKILTSELESQVEYLKKIIRDNKEKLNFDLKDLDKRRTKNRKLGKQLSKKLIEQKPSDNRDSTTLNQQSREMQRRSSKMQKKSKRLQRVGAPNSSFFKPTEPSLEPTKENNTEAKPSEQSKENKQAEHKDKHQNEQMTKNSKVEIKKAMWPVPIKQIDSSKQSFFRNQSTKRNLKKTIQQDRQVSFVQQKYKKNIVDTIPLEDNNVSEVGPINLSIDDIKNEDENQYQASSQKSKKNTLRQIINSSAACSLRSFQNQNKKSSKSVSKKCIILKDNKEKDKNILATTIKFQNLSINQVIQMTIFPQIPLSSRKQRPSYPFANSQQGVSSNLISSNPKLAYLSNEASKKKLNSQNSTHYMEKIKQISSKQKPSFAETVKKRQNLPAFKKSMSKKQNQPQAQLHHTFSSTATAQYSQNSHLRLNKPSNTSQKTTIKDVTAYLETFNAKNREVSLCQRLNSYVEQNWNTNESSEPNTFVNYIIEQLTRQQLSFQQFKQIVNCIQETTRGQQRIRDSNNNKREHDKSLEQGFKTIHNSKEYLINTRRYSKIRESKEERKFSKQEKVTRVKTDQIFGIGEHIYQNIRHIHAKISNCNNKDNQPCEHLIKYLAILKKVNETYNQKPAIKLHIQKIGQLLQYNFEKQHKKLQQLKHMEKLQQLIQKANKSNYNKLNASNQYIVQQQRILPVINATTTSYYKGKTKLIK